MSLSFLRNTTEQLDDEELWD